MNSASIKLKIPKQGNAAPTRFSPDIASAKLWLKNLSSEAFVDELSDALQELNACKLAPQLRYDLTEVLRPFVQSVTAQLSRQFLGQAPLLPKQGLQQAEQVDRLCTLLGTAYTIVAVEIIQTPDAAAETNRARLACAAIHRSLVCSSQEVLQAVQLYRPLRIYAWLNLHQLYLLAQQQQLAHLPVPDPLDAGKTIAAVYIQSILLSCCQPNRLRPSDLSALYSALSRWSEYASLKAEPADSDLFLIELDSDQPPLSHEIVSENVAGRRVFLHTSALTEYLSTLRTDTAAAGSTIEKGSRLSLNILDQIITSLASKPGRNYNRIPSSSKLFISMGLINSHYHVASQLIFEQVLYGVVFQATKVIDEARFTPPLPFSDPWHKANPSKDYLHSAMTHSDESIDLDEVSRARLFRSHEKDGLEYSAEQYPTHKVTLADVSPGGYCLELDTAFTGGLRTGELLCLREGDNEQWQIGVIRWMHMANKARLLAGLELLAPRATAFGACIHETSGTKAAPIRALLLPELKIVGQPSTLLTPRASFRTGHKITLVTADKTLSIQLTNLMSYTGSYSQFEFKYIQELGDRLTEEEKRRTEGPDSLWNTI